MTLTACWNSNYNRFYDCLTSAIFSRKNRFLFVFSWVFSTLDFLIVLENHRSWLSHNQKKTGSAVGYSSLLVWTPPCWWQRVVGAGRTTECWWSSQGNEDATTPVGKTSTTTSSRRPGRQDFLSTIRNSSKALQKSCWIARRRFQELALVAPGNLRCRSEIFFGEGI